MTHSCQAALPLVQMKRSKYPISVVLAAGGCLLAVRARGIDTMPSVSSATNVSTQMTSSEVTNNPGRSEAQRAYDDYVAKQIEDRIRGVPPPPSQFPFPNVEGWTMHPPPNYVNFYRIDDRYPKYLLCEYPVDEKNYKQAKEAKWFEAALKQVRHYGTTKFPPIEWIAVAVRNVAEHKDASTFEQSYKVGAVFSAREVFDSSRDISQLVANAVMNRHPFRYDEQQSTDFSTRPEHWMIVEQHAVAMSGATNSNEKATEAEPHK